MKNTRIGIALIFDQHLSSEIMKVQQKVAEVYEISPLLSVEGNIPHLTILQGTIATKTKIDSMWATIADDLVEEVFPKELQLRGTKYKDVGWYFLSVIRDMQLVKLQSIVLEKMEQYIVPPVDIDYKKIEHYSPVEHTAFLKYGYRYIGDAFIPHITLGRVRCPSVSSNEIMVVVKGIIEKAQLPEKIAPIALTMYRQGIDGAHAEILAKRSFI